MGKYALLIGVSEYGKGLKPLPAATNDVAALQEVLQHPNTCDFDQVKTIENPTQSEMAREIEIWFQSRNPDDLILLFFSGHGIKDDSRRLYFAARNTEKHRNDLVRSTATSARFVDECIRRCKAKYQVIILDCCFSGAFGNLVSRDDNKVNIQEQLGAEGRVVLTSTSAVDYSFEENGAALSIYTRYLVEGITSGAADENEDGAISVGELHRYASRKVEKIAPAMSPKIITLKDEGYLIRLARSPQDDPKLKYRKEVERKATTGDISTVARRLLNSIQKELGISAADAQAIETEVFRPYIEYKSKCQEYAETLQECLHHEKRLNQRIIKDLIDFREHLRLNPDDVAAIDQELLGNSLEEYQIENNQQQNNQAPEKTKDKFQRSRDRLSEDIQPHPLDQNIQKKLKNPHEQISLNDEEDDSIEQPIRSTTEVQQEERKAAIKRQSDIGEKENLERQQVTRSSRKHQKENKQQPPVTGATSYRKQILGTHRYQDRGYLCSTRFGYNYYAKLQNLLVAKNWQAANKETANCMCAVMGRQKEGWLNFDSVRNFPSLDLKNINSLWMNYSQGRFGFTVQRRIWENCDRSFFYDNLWGKFGEAVGWRTINKIDNKWLYYSQLSFSITAPKGHLPCVTIENSERLGFFVESQRYLFTRLDLESRR